ncbi:MULTISPECIES: GNAT family N-acetyltransferase [unclassified Xanthobacter]|uniref:GNAT family N-acetyltransferase n=1 Tax=unclassified Xanthobacter TaxID=2623496 RepID=UPI001EDE2570|nr:MULTISPECIES: GNAT family N-acetyltransferase [unclassified Xanthobacter]
MNTLVIEIRRAKVADAPVIAAVHDAAWRAAYRGLIPGLELERMVERRGPQWWQTAIRRGSRISVLLVGDDLAGYVNFGGNRAKALPYGGEIYEIYLHPQYQGLGFGQRLFAAARRDLALARLDGLVVWALAENENAVGFYKALGGQPVASSTERFGTKTLDKIAFAWQR